MSVVLVKVPAVILISKEPDPVPPADFTVDPMT